MRASDEEHLIPKMVKELGLAAELCGTGLSRARSMPENEKD
jgi:hypothetical protein